MTAPQTISNTNASAWVPIARLMRAQGRHGEILADPLGDLDDLFSIGREVWLAADETGTRIATAPIRLEAMWRPTGRNAGRVVLKLEACNSIEAAEVLRGQYLLIPEATLPEPDEGTFFVRDLIGCTLFDVKFLEDASTETPVGEIVGVEYMVATDGRTRLDTVPDLLQVRATAAADNAEPVLIPFVQDWIEEVDTEDHRVAMRLPEGLFEAQQHTDTSPFEAEDGDD